MKVIVPFAPGFEEIEGITIVDVLRRAEINVTTVSLGNALVKGAHGIEITTTENISEIDKTDYSCIVLPGGMPGSSNLRDDERVISLIQDIESRNGLICAICAAPIVLAKAGVLTARWVTCYPGFEAELDGAEVINKPVVADSRIITAKGPGCAIPFALEIIKNLKDSETAENLKNDMQVYWMQ